MGCYKKPIFKTAIIGSLAMVSLGMVLVAEARAGCGNLEGQKAGAVQPLSWQGTGKFWRVSFLLVADREASVDQAVIGDDAAFAEKLRQLRDLFLRRVARDALPRALDRPFR